MSVFVLDEPCREAVVMADRKFNVNNLAVLDVIFPGFGFRGFVIKARWCRSKFFRFPVFRFVRLDIPVLQIRICNKKWYAVCLIKVTWITY